MSSAPGHLASAGSSCSYCIGDFALCQGLGLHLQIDFDVNVGRVERDMPEPGADGVDINASAKQVRDRGMSNSLIRICAASWARAPEL